MRYRSLTKQIVILTSILLVISILISVIQDGSLSLLSIINSSFIVGMVVFLLSSFLLILKVGFFDAITHSFRKFFQTFSKQGQLMGDDLDQMAMPSEYQYSFAKPLLISSVITLVIMMFLLFIYYV